jgi:hypothetical protein
MVAGMEVFLRLFRLKIGDQEQVYLLRGDPETMEKDLHCGFFE